MQRRMHLGIALALGFLVSACASALGVNDVTPAEIPSLERHVADNPTDVTALVRLGAAYGAANRGDDARATFERAVALPGAPPAAWAHLGTWREAAGDLDGALEAYRQYLEAGGRAVAEVEARIERVEREQLQQQVRNALAREAEISAEPVDPELVGVMELMVDGPPQYEPLGVGLAELLTTDLSITGRLRVLERSQLAALIEEMKLGLAGFTDPSSAARAGRLLRAGRIVQGRIAIAEEQGSASVQALVVNADNPAGSREAAQQGLLEGLMDLEIQLALQIYRSLGIELTPAERARLEDKPTRNLQAFLAYSEGLQLLDQGDYGAAAGRFEAAATIDPGFEAASTEAERAQQMGSADPGSVNQVTQAEMASATSSAGPPTSGPPPDATSTTVEGMVNNSVPAGTSATSTGTSSTSTSSESTTVESTETTAGTGIGQVVRIPIVLVRPRPYLMPWRLR